MKAFPPEDLAKNLSNFGFECEDLPTQRSLGIGWNLRDDTFEFNLDLSRRPITRRGILATVNSLFDPLGFVAPITVRGKLILRDLMSIEKAWDEPVPSEVESKFVSWRDSLSALSKIQIPRRYFSVPVKDLLAVELHIFSDASTLAIAAVAYLVGILPNSREVSFVFGKAKVAPHSGHTIPRLELCGAVLAVEVADCVLRNIGLPVSVTRFYTDSRVVLGYINNQSRRFYTYVANRAQRIRQFSSPQQWSYICTSQNPADIGSRGIQSDQLQHSAWSTGPSKLYKEPEENPEFVPLIDSENV